MGRRGRSLKFPQLKYMGRNGTKSVFKKMATSLSSGTYHQHSQEDQAKEAGRGDRPKVGDQISDAQEGGNHSEMDYI